MRQFITLGLQDGTAVRLRVFPTGIAAGRSDGGPDRRRPPDLDGGEAVSSGVGRRAAALADRRPRRRVMPFPADTRKAGHVMYRRRRSPGALSTLLLVVALPIVGCSSSSSGPKSPNAAAGEIRQASGTASSPVNGAPGPAPSAAGPGTGSGTVPTAPTGERPTDRQAPGWHGSALPGPKADIVAERLKQQWGLEFHVQQIRSVSSGLPGHVEYEALKDLPGGYSLTAMIQADGDSRPRNIVLAANGAPSGAMAATLVQALDLSLHGHAGDERKSWVNSQFAAYGQSAQVSPMVPRSTDGEVTTSLTVAPDRTTLQLSSPLPS
nr:hypothetical protein KPHV_00880 [Kitasatospora purpeofusca]